MGPWGKDGRSGFKTFTLRYVGNSSHERQLDPAANLEAWGDVLKSHLHVKL